jgi:DNA-directed RNA polymerase specialized sigma24 family protein
LPGYIEKRRTVAALLAECLPALASYVRRLARDRDLANDIVQEVCLRVLVGEGPRLSENALAWTRGIARHVARAEWRRRRAWQTPGQGEELPENLRDRRSTPEEVADARASLARIFHGQAGAALLLRRHGEARDPTALARELELTPAALRMRLLRLRRSARALEET